MIQHVCPGCDALASCCRRSALSGEGKRYEALSGMFFDGIVYCAARKFSAANFQLSRLSITEAT